MVYLMYLYWAVIVLEQILNFFIDDCYEVGSYCIIHIYDIFLHKPMIKLKLLAYDHV